MCEAGGESGHRVERKASSENYNIPWSGHPIQLELMACVEDPDIPTGTHETMSLKHTLTPCI